MGRSMAVRGWQPARKIRRQERRSLALALMMATCALLVLMAWPSILAVEDTTVQTAAAEEDRTMTLPASMMLGLPDASMQRLTVTTERLQQGRMLLVDEEHPIPTGVEPQGTLSVLGYAHGRIGCRDLQAQLGREALICLEDLCVDARNRGISHLTVFAGTRSPEQQRLLLNEQVEKLSRDMAIEEAVAQAKKLVPPPGYSEHQLAWSVDIRICRGRSVLPDSGPLKDSTEGAWLVNNAWAYGFIQRWPNADPALDSHRPYCFRYVGLNHAWLMRELTMTLEDYLALLRTYGAVTMLDEMGAPLMSAVCVAAGERHTVFDVPENIEIEDASLDNTGYAILSFTYHVENAPV